MRAESFQHIRRLRWTSGPLRGGYVEFTLKHRGAYPFVTHSFADMMRGAMGALVTQGVRDSAAAAL